MIIMRSVQSKEPTIQSRIQPLSFFLSLIFKFPGR